MRLHFLTIFILGSFLNIQTSYGVDFDNIANYLAGYDSPEDHKEAMDKLWEDYTDKNLNYLMDWQENEISPIDLTDNCKVFYPFSGPDVVHMLTLFPDCKKYVMVGLEPHGKIEKLTKDKIDLAHLRTGIASLLNKSFFITSEMWGDFRIEKNGLLIPMIALLKRMDFKIINIEQFNLNNNAIVNYNDNRGNGIKITCRHPNQDYDQEIYYIRQSLSDSNHGIDKFIQSDNYRLVTYLKAAQYTLFDYRFAKIREAIVDKSYLVLQDDSGMPYKYLNNSHWQVTFYGDYQGPYGESFKGYIQPDLKKAYEKSTPKPLPFSLGYGYRKINTILIKAVKNNLNN